METQNEIVETVRNEIIGLIVAHMSTLGYEFDIKEIATEDGVPDYDIKLVKYNNDEIIVVSMTPATLYAKYIDASIIYYLKY